MMADVILFSFFIVVGQVEGGDGCAQSMALIIGDGRGRMVHHLWPTLLMLGGDGGVQSMATPGLILRCSWPVHFKSITSVVL